MRRFPTVLAWISLSIASLGSAASADDVPACNLVLYRDEALLKALPERLRPIVESARIRGILANRDAIWADYHRALDLAFDRPDRYGEGRIGDLSALVQFRKNRSGELELLIKGVKRAGVDAGETAPGGSEFLDFVAANLEWIAKARASGKIPGGLRIVGGELENDRMISLLDSLGFKPGRATDRFRCYALAVGGALAGYGAGRVYFMLNDANVENGSIYEEQRRFYRDIAWGGGGGALAGTIAAKICLRKGARDYSLKFDPEEIMAKSGAVPERQTLPIQPVVPVKPERNRIFPPGPPQKPALPALPPSRPIQPPGPQD